MAGAPSYPPATASSAGKGGRPPEVPSKDFRESQRRAPLSLRARARRNHPPCDSSRSRDALDQLLRLICCRATLEDWPNHHLYLDC
mmetsp:Transcript_19826/g.57675  ORF Transcript_19826/g.57675 Transcript_19826/m.57675 type:complete len:86 (-) Transcript_19826:11-268(-)